MATSGKKISRDPDDDGVSFEFRLLTEEDKNSIAFNDGDLSYFVTLVGETEMLHAVAQFRSMTGLSEAEYRAAFPVTRPACGSVTFETLLYGELKRVAAEIEETLGTYDFRVINEEEKQHVKFNDGDLAFTIEFRDKRKGDGSIYSVGMFRTMTELGAEEFKAAYPVVFDQLWHIKVPVTPMENILREGWAKKLAGDILFNDGERLIKHMMLDNGELGMDYLLRTETDLSSEAFLQTYPVTFDQPWTSQMVDGFLEGLGKKGLLHEQKRRKRKEAKRDVVAYG